MDIGSENLSDTDYLQLLMSRCIEPEMPANCFIYDYPLAQAALATVQDDAQEQAVAKRFELFCNGMELANGYLELTDADEQRARFETDLKKRELLELPQYPLDEKFLSALAHGIPDCAGVALGIDRLLMLLTGATHIDEVIAFTTDRT
jgi:lysyl-tRNA synthetase class 2